MDRIVLLRKDCIRGLGVQLLHKAYELLDQNIDEDILQVCWTIVFIILLVIITTKHMSY